MLHTARQLGTHLGRDDTRLLAELPSGHLVQRVGRPLREPVDGGAVDEAREHAAALAEGITHRAEAQHNMQVGTNTLQEEGVHLPGEWVVRDRPF